MAEKYVQLSIEERAVIQVQHDKGCWHRAIARSLHRDSSTISRELRRNRLSGHYHPKITVFTGRKKGLSAGEWGGIKFQVHH